MAEELPEVVPAPKIAEKIILRPIETEMKKSYIDYAMSVIVGRALPDVRDGLKPVHRRILYAMNEMGLVAGKPHKKSARVVGEVLGKYHPHGDLAIYDTLIRMAQPFSLRYRLIDGQGNFGSIDGDSAAAMRYTECRLGSIADELLADIDKETVDFTDNFDASLKEPLVLPSKLPNLLVNGSSGIAVGMATNIPPHNLGEVCDAIIHAIDHPDCDVRDLIEILRGPDFPTGGIIYGAQGIVEAYHAGRGRIRVRARTTVERDEEGGGPTRILVTEIPYQVNKAALVESIAELVKQRKIEGIADLRDESDWEGLQIVIELRRDALEDVVLNQLFAHTQLEVTFGIINLALVDNQPRVLSLKEMLDYFIEHRFDVVKRRTQYLLGEARKRAHILAGLIVAIDHLEAVIELIRKARSREEARAGLLRTYALSEEQVKAILELELQRLTGLERQKIKDEHLELTRKIEELLSILKDEKKIFGIIKTELSELRARYGDQRRTEIVAEGIDLDLEDLIPVEDVVVTISNTGYIKRLPLDTYEQQRRGGVGLIGMETKEEDYVVDLFVTSSHDYLMFFTSHGRVYWLKAYRVPVGARHAKGKPIVNLLERLEEGEAVMATLPVKLFDADRYLVFATKNGLIKKTALLAYSHVRVSGIVAIVLEEGDELIEVAITDGTKEIILATKQGQAIRFSESDVRPTGRATMGVYGIRMDSGDEVVSMSVVSPTSELLTVTEKGYGKRSKVEDYRKTHRGGKGVITIRTTERNGPVVSVKEVSDSDELIVTSTNGMVIRMPVGGITLQGRATQGVRVMRLKEGDTVSAVARLLPPSEELKAVEAGRTMAVTHEPALIIEEVPLTPVHSRELGEEVEEGPEMEELEAGEELGPSAPPAPAPLPIPPQVPPPAVAPPEEIPARPAPAPVTPPPEVPPKPRARVPRPRRRPKPQVRRAERKRKKVRKKARRAPVRRKRKHAPPRPAKRRKRAPKPRPKRRRAALKARRPRRIARARPKKRPRTRPRPRAKKKRSGRPAKKARKRATGRPKKRRRGR